MRVPGVGRGQGEREREGVAIGEGERERKGGKEGEARVKKGLFLRGILW